MKYIDLHTHIAYDIDDGIETKEDMISMLEMARKQSYEAIVLTPHINDQSSLDYYHKINQRYLEIKELAKDYNIDIYLGNEILINDHIDDLLNSKQFYTINNSSYILIECDLKQSYHHILDDLDHELNHILSLGYRPVIAHIERYYLDEIDLDYVEYLIQKGCLIQINTNSIIHKYKKVQPLLEHHYVHIVSSDAHNLKLRPLNLSDAYKMLESKHYDKKYLKDLFYHNPLDVIMNNSIDNKNYVSRNIIFKLLKI